MEKEKLKKILSDYKKGKTGMEAVLRRLKKLPFEELGFAKIDHHRALRSGFPEVVYCRGKSLEQLKKILKVLQKHNKNILFTRASREVYLKLKKINTALRYEDKCRAVYLRRDRRAAKGYVLVVCAGTADIGVAEEAALTAELAGSFVERVYDAGVAGLHRLAAHLDKVFKARSIVAVAGMEGALPSIVGGLSSCPVIAVPTSVGYGTNFKGLAPLLTMLNSCAPNVSVVNIDNGFGAGYIASLINTAAAIG